MENEVRNMMASHAGYFYIGHYCHAELKIILVGGGFGVEVNLKLSKSFDMYELFKVFDINPEDGKYLQEIEGKYCRVWFDKDRKVAALQHLTKDNIIWYVEGGKQS